MGEAATSCGLKAVGSLAGFGVGWGEARQWMVPGYTWFPRAAVGTPKLPSTARSNGIPYGESQDLLLLPPPKFSQLRSMGRNKGGRLTKRDRQSCASREAKRSRRDHTQGYISGRPSERSIGYNVSAASWCVLRLHNTRVYDGTLPKLHTLNKNGRRKRRG